eukprot:230719-Amorphochlora_amoeboformis.AAC.1
MRVERGCSTLIASTKADLTTPTRIVRSPRAFAISAAWRSASAASAGVAPCRFCPSILTRMSPSDGEIKLNGRSWTPATRMPDLSPVVATSKT